MLNLAAKWRNL